MDEIKKDLLAKIDNTKLPNHIAIIMDGNGRWAKKRGLPRALGHREGTKSTISIVEGLGQLRIKFATIYAFSTENWNRPESEINALLDLFRENFVSQKKLLLENGIKARVIGDYRKFPADIIDYIEELLEDTKNNSNLELAIALNYGSRQEIVRAVQKILKSGLKPDDVTLDSFSNSLDTTGMPDPDLLIRTSGEFRISNFLLWQMAYTEVYISDKFWPDFRANDLAEAVIWFQSRERRFGGLEKK